MYCSKCGVQNNDDANFCKGCGESLKQELAISNDNTMVDKQQKDVNDVENFDHKLLETFIAKPEKVAFYEDAFQVFENKSKLWKWSWWAFFGGILFLIHRKIYGIALAIIVISIILSLTQEIHPAIKVIALIFTWSTWIAIGGFGIKLVHSKFLHLKKIIPLYTSNQNDQFKEMTIKGEFVAIWKILVGFIIFIVVFVSLLMYVQQNNTDTTDTKISEETVQPIAAQAGDYKQTETTLSSSNGTLEAISTQLLYNGKPILDDGLLSIKHTVHLKNYDLSLIQSGGGTACPAMFYFVTTSKNRYTITPSFGTCTDIVHVVEHDNTISVSMNGFAGPFESEEFQEEVSRRMVTYTYENGKVIEQ